MKDGHDDFGGGTTFFGVYAGGNATPVVFNGDAFVGIDGNGDAVAIASKGFVDGVIQHFKHHVVQA